MTDEEILMWLGKMVRWHSRMDGTPRSFINDDKLDELVALGYAEKHESWCDITRAGRQHLEGGNPRLRLLMDV